MADPGSRPGIGLSLLPTGVFLLLNQLVGISAAVIAATVVSLIVIVQRRRSGQRVGILLPATLAYVVVRGIAGLITGSEDVYFGFGLALGAIGALAVGATAFTRRPAASYFIPAVVEYRPATLQHRLYRRVAAQVTVAWMVAELAITGWEAWHLTSVSANEFVALRTFVGWPAMAVWIFFLIFYVRMRLDPLDWWLHREDPATP